jgi:hypothetical protein
LPVALGGQIDDETPDNAMQQGSPNGGRPGWPGRFERSPFQEFLRFVERVSRSGPGDTAEENAPSKSAADEARSGASCRGLRLKRDRAMLYQRTFHFIKEHSISG